ncbi:AlbA family DNA-binding domain-containing protein [Spirosoma validum]|uniref:ATP-binding protein n=1 Tax=Spirosoma validum TaxID=2771355 RepID=A0A927AYA7_9BACT|nr:ATP-binding protein [Spirosoma validum]MBD2751996.1 ATP-binding protein [Spirosoma validum]
MASSFAQNQFGKSIDQVTASDLISFFSEERDESLTLEFKSFSQREGDIKHKENAILKTICGFLNSNGGLLIWGAPEEVKNTNGQKVFADHLSPVEKRYTRDDLISKISNRITPFAASVQVEPIEVEHGKFVYLIEVPESSAKPHQFDNIYYMRLDGQTKVAPHYVIDALFKQIKFPSLNVFLRLDGFTHRSGEVTHNSVNVLISCFLINSSKFIHEYDPYYIIDLGAGGFINKATNQLERIHHVYDIPSFKTLAYNVPLVRQEVFHMTIDQYHEWCDKNLSIPIAIVGGGKLSPLVSSSYKLELVSAKENKELVLNKNVPVDRVINLRPISLNQFKHDEWTGSEEKRLELIVNNTKVPK